MQNSHCCGRNSEFPSDISLRSSPFQSLSLKGGFAITKSAFSSLCASFRKLPSLFHWTFASIHESQDSSCTGARWSGWIPVHIQQYLLFFLHELHEFLTLHEHAARNRSTGHRYVLCRSKHSTRVFHYLILVYRIARLSCLLRLQLS